MIVDAKGIGNECCELSNNYHHWIFEYAHDLAFHYIQPDVSFVEWVEKHKGWKHIKDLRFQKIDC